ncbi:hypothetical protein GC173_02930 [bacterium]|nr:hypothetical protein [bacterium]
MDRTPGILERAFRRNAGEVYRREIARQQLVERDRRERREEIDKDETELMEFAVGMATVAEIDSFRIELDNYDTATVAALQLNERELLLVRERIDRLLAKAHVLPDGRRVFKTEDGLRVFDEHGAELSADIIDPQVIDDLRPRWEAFKPELDSLNTLLDQRAELLDYQSRLDEARERLDAGDLSRKEFEDLRTSIRDEMPEAVHEQVLAIDPDAPIAQKPQADAMADDLEFEDDMIPDTFARKSPAPGLDG